MVGKKAAVTSGSTTQLQTTRAPPAPPLKRSRPAALRPGDFRATRSGPCSSTNPAPPGEKKKRRPPHRALWGAPEEPLHALCRGARMGARRGREVLGSVCVGLICQDAGGSAGKAPPGSAPFCPRRFGANLHFPPPVPLSAWLRSARR